MRAQMNLLHGNNHLSGKRESGAKETEEKNGKGNGSKNTIRNPKVNWKKTAAQLKSKLDDLEEQHRLLKLEHNDLETKGLGNREAIKLRRLEHLLARVVNIPLSESSRRSLDELIHDETSHIKDLVWRKKS